MVSKGSSQDHRGRDASHKKNGKKDSGQTSKSSATHVRGATLMRKVRKLTLNNTRKIPVIVNPLGKPIGRFKSLFQSYIGQITRERISIAYTRWNEVPEQTIQGVKDAIMEHSKANSERSKKKKYPYKASSMGYDRLAEKILIAQNLDPETNIVGRAQLWKAARCEENGVYEDKETKKVADKIDILLEQESQGIITPTGREDILSLALETDEHSSRLRGVGFRIGAKKYFGSTKRTSSNSQQEVNKLRAEMAEMQKRMEMLEKYYKSMESQGSSHQPHVSPPAHQPHVSPPPTSHEEQEVQSPIIDRGLSMLHSPRVEPSKLQDSTKKCKLAWPDRSCEVAKGRAFIPMAGHTTILHGKQLDASVLKVTIDTVVKENAKVPFPTEEVPFLSDNAVGNIIAWPKDMVIFETDLHEGSKGLRKALFQPIVRDKFQPAQRYPTIEKCRSLITSDGNFTLKINIPKPVVQHSYTLELNKEDVLTWLARGELDGVHIILYIKHHWMLGVIDPVVNIVYWLDPLREDIGPHFKEMCQTLLNMLNVKESNLQEICVKRVECPEQYDSISCGLFVCRFMRDIVRSGVIEIPTSYLPPSPQTNTEEEIFEVIEEGSQYLLPFLQLEVTSSSQHKSKSGI